MIELKNIVNIRQGQSVAFTGHNGCGKSTLLKVIAGLVRPTKGTVCLNMEGGHSNEEKAVIGNTHSGNLIHYVPEHFPQMQLTARRYLHYMGKIDALSHTGASRHMENKCSMGNKCSVENKCSEDKCSNEEKTFIEAPHGNKKLECVELGTHINELAEEFFVSNMLDIPMKYLSKGSLQKIGMIQALLKEPDILLLDEPLSGQDMSLIMEDYLSRENLFCPATDWQIHGTGCFLSGQIRQPFRKTGRDACNLQGRVVS